MRRSRIADRFRHADRRRRVALGPDVPAFYTEDERLPMDVARAKAENDPLWRLPCGRPYD